MTAIVNLRARCSSTKHRQSGVALLQALLLGAIFSLFSMSISQTVQNQLEIVGQVEGKLRAQLAAYTTVNEIIFLLLSEDSTHSTGVYAELQDNYMDPNMLNSFGEPVDWRNQIIVSVQDLSGMLPHHYPHQPLWSYLLSKLGMNEKEVDSHLGIWSDFQDFDRLGWVPGDLEPQRLASGHKYFNGYSQTNNVLKWVFEDKPELIETLLGVSDIHARYETNLFNSPQLLLEALFDPNIVQAVMSSRAQGDMTPSQLISLLPNEVAGPHLSNADSALKRIEVGVVLDNASWSERRLVRLSPGDPIPYKFILAD